MIALPWVAFVWIIMEQCCSEYIFAHDFWVSAMRLAMDVISFWTDASHTVVRAWPSAGMVVENRAFQKDKLANQPWLLRITSCRCCNASCFSANEVQSGLEVHL